AKDPDWHVPVLWRSELRSILTGYLRDGSLSRTQITRVMEAIEEALEPGEHLLSSARVFDVAQKSQLSAYDCEFVALASALSVPLVTADKTVLRAFPGLALTMDAFFET
ncbi:MAG: type II toxin-antitoxin system VapC family toxin, partial [Gammaproteobacteria bacterium]